MECHQLSLFVLSRILSMWTTVCLTKLDGMCELKSVGQTMPKRESCTQTCWTVFTQLENSGCSPYSASEWQVQVEMTTKTFDWRRRLCIAVEKGICVNNFEAESFDSDYLWATNFQSTFYDVFTELNGMKQFKAIYSNNEKCSFKTFPRVIRGLFYCNMFSKARGKLEEEFSFDPDGSLSPSVLCERSFQTQ